MATVGSLVIQLQLDDTRLRSGLAKQERLIQEFGRDLTSTILPEGAAVNAGQKAAAALISGLVNRRTQEQNRIDRAFAAKEINETQWKLQGMRARLAFNNGLLEGEDRLKTRYNISPDTTSVLRRHLDTAAVAADAQEEARTTAAINRAIRQDEQKERQMVKLHAQALEQQERMDEQARARSAAADRAAVRLSAEWRRNVIKTAVDPRLTSDLQSPLSPARIN
jgi:hypothetical protein